MYKVIDFSKYSSIKVGTKTEVRIFEDDFSDFEKYHLIGGANNLFISLSPPPLAVLSKRYDYIKYEDGLLKIGGATPSGKIHSFCKKNNVGGLEFLGKLPGKLGGLIKMNAGMKEYEIFEFVHEVVTHEGRYKKEEMDFGYRYTGIKGAILEASFVLPQGFSSKKLGLFGVMRDNQPKDPSAGSVFKNPKGDSAGRLIDCVGLKGRTKGAMGWSEKHANFLVNLGSGSFKDGLFLIELAEKRVFEEFGIALEREIIVLNN